MKPAELKRQRSPKRAPKADKPKADSAAADAIGRQLRDIYDQVVSEPVPEHLMELLSRLDREPGEQ